MSYVDKAAIANHLRAIPGGKAETLCSWLEECSTECEEWLVDRIVPRKSYFGIFGKRGAAKSFLALDLACNAAIGKPFLGEQTQTFGTLYCVGEKKARFGKRVTAWRENNNVERTPVGVCFRWGVPNLLDDADVSAFIAEVAAMRAKFAERGAPLGAIIFDTLARTLKHANVSDADAAGGAIESIQRIIDELGVTVIPLAHVAKAEGSASQKGAGEWEDAADGLLRIDRPKETEKLRVVTMTKQSDEADGQSYGFELDAVEVGQTPDGKRITSCVVRCVEVPNGAQKRLTGNARIAADALGYLLDNHLTAQAPPTFPGIAPGTPIVVVDEWKARAGEMGLFDEEDTASNRRQKWHAAKSKMRDLGLVRIEGQYAVPLDALGGVRS